MKAPVSLCMIVKNEGPRLAACLSSFRPYVKEIICVDTGSTDNTLQIANELADKVITFTDCNDSEGRIEDFSLARNKSFELATQPWVIWADGDDVVRGAENLPNIIKELEAIKDDRPITVMFQYEYAHDQDGNVRILQYRERLFSNKDNFKWINKVHEVVCPLLPSNLQLIRYDMTWVHQRGDKQIESGRNLRIMKKIIEELGETDIRQLYYAGLEYFNNNEPETAIKYMDRYAELSGWSEEIWQSYFRVGQYYINTGNYKKAIEYAFKAVSTHENWCEAYLMLSKAFYLMAISGQDTIRNYQKCIHFAELGLSYPETKTLLFIDPMDRSYEVHKFLHIAYSNTGNIDKALESCELGLQANPNDKWLLSNKKAFQKHILRIKFNGKVADMLNAETITQDEYDGIMKVLDSGESNASSYPSYKKSVNYPDGVTSDHFPTALITPHAQAWGIPKDFELNDLPVRLTDDQLQSVVLLIWKEYILQDEILSAISFLEKTPYRIRNTAATEKALSITNGMISWIKDMSLIQKHNSPAEPEREGGNPLPNILINQEGGRFNLVLSRLPAKSSLVDFGCFDGCFTNRYGMAGHEVYGLDLVETSVKLANKKAIEFNTGAKHVVTMFEHAANKVPNGYFNFATSTDTYEHLLDPVKEMLLPAKKMLKEDGKFLLVTPYGSWLRGNYCDWAHPWLYGKEGIAWNAPMPRAHLIAPTAWSVAKDFRDAGYWVKDSYPVLCEPFKDVDGQGNVFSEAWLQAPVNDNPMDIVFYIGDGLEYWTPKTVERTGIGGSELLAIQQAKELSMLGHKVRVYSGVGPHGEGIYDGVEYRSSNKFQDLKCDVLIVSRMANMLDDNYNIKADLKILWCHDVVAVNATNSLLLKADKIFALTEWHKQFLIEQHNLHPDHVIVTRNGVYTERFDKIVERQRYKIVNSSSPDRGWKTWFAVWDRVLEQVPEAQLHLYYGFENMRKVAQWRPDVAHDLAFFESKLQEYKDKGVHFHGRVSQEYLTNQFLTAEIWGHGSNFTETSCITAMEAQLAGLDIVTSSVAALNETVGERGVLIPGDCDSLEYQDKFVLAVVDKLKNPSSEETRKELIKSAKDLFDMKQLSKEWCNNFKNLIEEKKTNPGNKYQPTDNYK